MIINKYILISICLLFLGCTTPKFYSELKSTYNGKKTDTREDKEVLKKLKTELNNSSHIIYVYMPDYTAASDMNRGFIYDVDNAQYYNIIFNEGKNIDISKTEYPKGTYEIFIIEKYLIGEYDYLKKLNEKYFTSKGKTTNTIYDINLKTNEYKRFVFYNFPFEDGKPSDGMQSPLN